MLDSEQPSTSRTVLEELNLGEHGEFTSFEHYMHTKVVKLKHQVHDGAVRKSNIFESISIYVNGYTEPNALTLRKMIVENGGSYHHYYNYGKTTHIIANNLSENKRWNSLRKDEKVIKPEWIVRCVEAGRLLPDDEFVVVTESSARNKANDTQAKFEAVKPQSPQKSVMTVSEFYGRSRLHLISTLAQDMKKFVSDLRSKGPKEFPARARLKTLAGTSDIRSVAPSSLICHLDMDCFFVSVALRDRPDLIGKPVAVTHSRGTQGKGFSEIASCSYEARKFKIRSGMLVNKAAALCPDLICLPYQFEEYRKMTHLFYSTIANFTSNIKAVSCDEMYIDLGELCGQVKQNDPLEVVKELRKEIFETLGCTVSFLGENLLLARLATKKAKPNGQYCIRAHTEVEMEQFMHTVEIRDLPGVGYATMEKIREAYGDAFTFCLHLQQIKLSQLQSLLATDNSTRKSVSCDVNFGIRMSTAEELENFYGDISAKLSAKLENLGLLGQTLTLKLLIRAADAPIEPEKHGGHGQCDVFTKSFALARPVSSPQDILNGVIFLNRFNKAVIADIRGIGIQMTHLLKIGKKETSTTTKCISRKKEGYFALRKPKPNSLGISAKSKRSFKAAKPPLIVEDDLDEISEQIPLDPLYSDPKFSLELLGISYDTDPTEELVKKMLKNFSIMVENADFALLKSTFSCFRRTISDNSQLYRYSDAWLTMIASLKQFINEECTKKYGATLL
ncbi:impB/mucB/samB family domain-containing protein [Ditylenchus destructor]|uniref:DNA repair protein REV1 n=1 Tax=Ditylenchus destructor TaxID=166010 RepID=A0AAD4N9A0_9BILA|nr:impB/mucB/samB family domain-containing protein [Ditylenchus destructor]